MFSALFVWNLFVNQSFSDTAKPQKILWLRSILLLNLLMILLNLITVKTNLAVGLFSHKDGTLFSHLRIEFGFNQKS